MDKNPVEWLLARNPGVSRAAWGLFFCVAITTTVAFVLLPKSAFVTVLPFFYLAGYAFKLLAFSAGCDFFLRERKSGGMELMLTSMLTASEIRTGAVFGFARPILTAFACSAGIWMCFGVAAIAIAGSSADSMVLMAAIAAVSAMDLVSVLTTSLLSGAEFPSYRKAAGMAWIRGIAAPTVMVVAFRADGGFPGAIAGALIGSAIASWWAWQAITRELEALRKAAPESAFSPAFSHHFTHPSSGTPR